MNLSHYQSAMATEQDHLRQKWILWEGGSLLRADPGGENHHEPHKAPRVVYYEEIFSLCSSYVHISLCLEKSKPLEVALSQ